MNLRLVLNPGARLDFDEATDWYHEQDESVKIRFVEAVHSVFVQILRSPLSFPVVHGSNVRQAQVRKFPYTIFYTIQPKRILVYSVFHTSRNPTIWRRRVG